MKVTQPTRPYSHPRFRYTPAVATDIRKTFAKFARLQRMRQQGEAAVVHYIGCQP